MSPTADLARAMWEDDARTGLGAAQELGVGKGYAELLGGYSQLGGAFAKAETGWNFAPGWSLFGTAGLEGDAGFGASGGVRFEW